ncbi:MAG TPA: alkaline phosphatase family protein [Candidatus Eisenbacteria bacterium]|nr:alkaline phosphatase family protein [Candidatus Eisenbacteria bacterium]
MTRRRLVLLGLDAADIDLVEAHRGALPTLRRVLGDAAVTRLDSTAGLLPGSVWPTFATGVLPGVHGVYHHLQWDAAGMRLRRVAGDWLDWEPFWNGLERRGLDVAVLDVPMTFPSRLARGIEVTNWGSHDQLGPFAARPAAVGTEIRRRFGRRHPMGYEIPVDKTPAQLGRIRRDLVAGAARKGELVRWLLGRRDWDLFLAVFGETHRGGHILWPETSGGGLDALLDVYRAVDTALGAVLDAVPRDATIVVFSLHGMGPNISQEHFVPLVVDRLNAGHGAAATPARRGLVRWLRDRVPAGAQNAVARMVPVAVRDEVMNRQITGGRDWTSTPGLALLADLNGYLRWNLRGRERDGCLDADGDALRRYAQRTAECFRGLRAADTGMPLVADVALARDAFAGPRVANLPDAVVTWVQMPPVARVRSEHLGEMAAELATGRGGNHRPVGFCAILGPEETRRQAAHVRHIADLAPLVTERIFGPR